jgi:site-specific DNA recombinase
MRMGGVPPLGYQVRDRKLVVIPEEAETVRHIFGRNVALGSVRLLQAELEAQNIASKRWTSAAGRIYRGEIVRKDQSYPGEHAAIIDQALVMRLRSGSWSTRSSAAQISG